MKHSLNQLFEQLGELPLQLGELGQIIHHNVRIEGVVGDVILMVGLC